MEKYCPGFVSARAPSLLCNALADKDEICFVRRCVFFFLGVFSRIVVFSSARIVLSGLVMFP